MEPTGYLHRAYAASLSEFGSPRELRRAGTWVLDRPIAGGPERDAMACYPILSCADWRGLTSDLEDLRDLVCLTAVADPFGDHDAALLRCCFPDLVVPFKEHFVVDLAADPAAFVSEHHRRNARKALEKVSVQRCAVPQEHAAEWIGLYRHLIARHSIRGIAAFSEASLAMQLKVPGLEMFRAIAGEETVGIVLWTIQNGVAYYHLAAYSENGYRHRASFAVFWTAFQFFVRRGIRWVSLGAGAGIQDDRASGLNRFKRGWSTETRTAYLCGRVLNRRAYERLAGPAASNDYFPPYRKGEFA